MLNSQRFLSHRPLPSPVRRNRDPSVFQRNIVSQRLIHTVYVIILRLQQKGWRRLVGDVNVRSQPEVFLI